MKTSGGASTSAFVPVVWWSGTISTVRGERPTWASSSSVSSIGQSTGNIAVDRKQSGGDVRRVQEGMSGRSPDVSILFFAAFTPISALLAEHGRRKMLMWVNVGIFAFGLVMAPLFAAGTAGAVTMVVQALSSLGSSRLRAICTLSLRLSPRTIGQ